VPALYGPGQHDLGGVCDTLRDGVDHGIVQ